MLGDYFTFKYINQLYNMDDLAKNSLKNGMTALFNIFKDIKLNNPIYCFALPGFALSIGGVYLGLSSLQTFYPGKSLDFGSAVFTALITFVGIGLAFTGILVHSISGLFRHLKE